MVIIVLEQALETCPFHLRMCQASRVQSYSIGCLWVLRGLVPKHNWCLLPLILNQFSSRLGILLPNKITSFKSTGICCEQNQYHTPKHLITTHKKMHHVLPHPRYKVQIGNPHKTSSWANKMCNILKCKACDYGFTRLMRVTMAPLISRAHVSLLNRAWCKCQTCSCRPQCGCILCQYGSEELCGLFILGFARELKPNGKKSVFCPPIYVLLHPLMVVGSLWPYFLFWKWWR